MKLPDAVAAITRSLPSPALIVARPGDVVFANGAAREAMALESEQPGKEFGELVLDSPEVVSGYLRMCARSVEPILGAFDVRRHGAPPLAMLSRGSLISPKSEAQPSLLLLRLDRKDPANPFILLSKTVRELTEEIQRRRDAEMALRASEAALRARALEAENASTLKDEFLATLSHELRTPLSAIVGWTRLMLDGRVPPDRYHHGLQVIERNARVQTQLVEDLLDVSRIVSGKLRLNVQQLDPIHFIEAALEAARPAADAKSIRLQGVLDPLAGPISGDSDRLQQVVWNLLNNALKFTPKGGRIQVLLERVDSSIEISISDTGIGIGPEFLPHIFDRFRQEEGSTTRMHGGLGLGLSIAKSLIELHGGTIRAHSDGLGKGASFHLRLPRTLVRAEPSPRPFASAAPQRSPSAPRPPDLLDLRIVVVDDESDALDVLSALLESAGAKVMLASSAEVAHSLVRSTRPDLLISDIGMPLEDGYSLIRRIRALPREEGSETPAIALTAFARSEDRTRALTAGFHAHLPKPVETSELFAVIASLVRRFKSGARG